MRAVVSFRAPALAGGVAPVTVTKSMLNEMAGAVQYALFNESDGMYWRMPEEDQEKIGSFGPGQRWQWGTVIDVDPSPTGAELAAAGARTHPETGNRDLLLGLFTGETDEAGNLIENPTPRIQLFAAEIIAAGYDPVDVAKHEIGHRLRYNDEHEVGSAQGAAAPVTLPPGENPCHFCAADEWLSTSERALFGLRERAHMQHRIPLGLGGRIGEVRARLDRAQAALDRADAAEPWLAGRQGELRQLRTLILAGQQTLEGEQLSPQDISEAHAYVNRAWDASYDLGHAYQVHVHHPEIVQR
jgi:hypothetical protein